MTALNIKHRTSNAPTLIAVVGETASGKTAAAIKLALEVDGEIICADSRTVYEGMDIGTAKPSKAEQQMVPHHLLDGVKPNETFNVAEFQRLANQCIAEIHARGKVPIMVGGTGLYIDSVLYNFQFTEPANAVYRAKLEQMNDVELTTLLHTKNINTETLNTKNRRHVIRAIERGGAVPNDKQLRENTLVLGLKLDRFVLKTRVENRVEQMFRDGFLDEIKRVTDTYGWDNESMSGIGYKMAREYFEGKTTESEVKQAFIKRDLSLAKRQRTWFKRNPHILWYESPEELIGAALAAISDN